MFRRFAKRRSQSTLQARQSGNLTFNRRAWPKGLCPPLSRHLARSDGLSLTYAPPAALPMLVRSDLVPAPTWLGGAVRLGWLTWVPGGCGGRVWLVPVGSLGIGEGLLRYNRLGH